MATSVTQLVQAANAVVPRIAAAQAQDLIAAGGRPGCRRAGSGRGAAERQGQRCRTRPARTARIRGGSPIAFSRPTFRDGQAGDPCTALGADARRSPGRRSRNWATARSTTSAGSPTGRTAAGRSTLRFVRPRGGRCEPSASDRSDPARSRPPSRAPPTATPSDAGVVGEGPYPVRQQTGRQEPRRDDHPSGALAA